MLIPMVFGTVQCFLQNLTTHPAIGLDSVGSTHGEFQYKLYSSFTNMPWCFIIFSDMRFIFESLVFGGYIFSFRKRNTPEVVERRSSYKCFFLISSS